MCARPLRARVGGSACASERAVSGRWPPHGRVPAPAPLHTHTHTHVQTHIHTPRLPLTPSQMAAAGRPAALVGLTLARHFDAPLKSGSLAEFWARRWNQTQAAVLRWVRWQGGHFGEGGRLGGGSGWLAFRRGASARQQQQQCCGCLSGAPRPGCRGAGWGRGSATRRGFGPLNLSRLVGQAHGRSCQSKYLTTRIPTPKGTLCTTLCWRAA